MFDYTFERITDVERMGWLYSLCQEWAVPDVLATCGGTPYPTVNELINYAEDRDCSIIVASSDSEPRGLIIANRDGELAWVAFKPLYTPEERQANGIHPDTIELYVQLDMALVEVGEVLKLKRSDSAVMGEGLKALSNFCRQEASNRLADKGIRVEVVNHED